MFSGWLQEQLGYQTFFVWVMIATILIPEMNPMTPFSSRATQYPKLGMTKMNQ